MACSDHESRALIEEFDSEVTSRSAEILRSTENTAQNMQSALDLILSSVPRCIRRMSLKTLLETYDGDFQKAASCFSPKSSMRSPLRARPGQAPTYGMSLSELLKHQANSTPRTPTKSPSQNRNGNGRTPTKTPARSPQAMTPTRSPGCSSPRRSPRTPNGATPPQRK
jgi:hypothetical protein